MIRKKNCTRVGSVLKTHGTEGYLVADIPEDYANIIIEKESVFVEIDQGLVPFFLLDFEIVDTHTSFICFEEVDDIPKARFFCGKNIYIPSEEIGIKTDTSIPDISGYQATDKQAGVIGTISQIIQHPGNPLMEIDPGAILIPLTPDLIVHINHDKKQIELDLPEGLTDLQ